MRAPLTLLLLLLADFAAADSAKLAFFESHVRPVLIEHCYDCHSAEAKKVKGGLLLDSRLGWQIGGDSGASIVPGDPDASLLMTALHYKDNDLKMPPKYRLSKTDAANLQKWIADGAVDPREGDVDAVARGEIDLEAGREFWSFQPLRSPQAPSVRSSQWPRDPVDHFVLEKLEAAGLSPTEDASRRALIRRASYDLTGLPPTPAEIADFLADSHDGAFARVVDRLLAKRAFGEHWGRHWLDVARFAESSGGGRSLMFPVAWRFRDYVIDAMNADKPFDQFAREQIAGDLLPWKTPQQRNEQLVASGYLLLGPTNYEQQDKALLTMDVIDEQIDTMGRGFLGMSLGCARCHDHKFDPVPTADYYALAGIFGSTEMITPGNVSGYMKQTLERLTPISDKEKAHAQKVATLSEELAAVKAELVKFPATNAKRGIDPASVAGIVVDDPGAERIGSWVVSTHTMGYLGDNYLHDSHGNSGPAKAIFRPKITVGGQYEVRVSYTASGNRATNARVTIDHADGRSEKRINQTQPPPIDGSFVSLGMYRLEADIAISVTIDNDKADGVVIVDAVQILRPKIDVKPTAVAADKPATPPMVPAERKRLDAKAAELNKKLAALKKNASFKPGLAMAVKDSGSPTDGHVHIRGGVRNKGAKVARGFLRVAMTAEQAAAPPVITGSGRLELAEWLISPDNPLTARVTVNRLWKHLFGVGIVRTVDNFGKTGELPSHPELLDFLATRFVADGWSLKREIRRLMLSRSYQMAATGNAGMAIDPENRLLWRAQRRRLAAEGLRDAMLSVSGQLEPATGGLTIRKLAQYDLNYAFGSRKRGVYVPAFRNSVLPLFEVFDAANPNLVVGARNTSNLPTQALYLMNSPFVQDQAAHAAKRLLAEQQPEIRLDYLYEHALGRLPRPEERKLAEAHLATFDGKNAESAAWTSVCHALFACIDFRFID
ncbi:MAG: hypothetical protein ACI8W8_000965 [Rhodothermales bacterium]|jgi:hypothetical protein